MKNNEELLDKFNQLEIFDASLTDKINICLHLEKIVKDNDIQKQIKLERDLLYFYMIMLSCLDDERTFQRNSQHKINDYNNILKNLFHTFVITLII